MVDEVSIFALEYLLPEPMRKEINTFLYLHSSSNIPKDKRFSTELILKNPTEEKYKQVRVSYALYLHIVEKMILFCMRYGIPLNKTRFQEVFIYKAKPLYLNFPKEGLLKEIFEYDEPKLQFQDFALNLPKKSTKVADHCVKFEGFSDKLYEEFAQQNMTRKEFCKKILCKMRPSVYRVMPSKNSSEKIQKMFRLHKRINVFQSSSAHNFERIYNHFYEKPDLQISQEETNTPHILKEPVYSKYFEIRLKGPVPKNVQILPNDLLIYSF